MSQDLKNYPRHFPEFPSQVPRPLECMLRLQELWKDHEHFDYVDACTGFYIVRLRIPRDGSHYVKQARYEREVKLDINPETGDVQWVLVPDSRHGDFESFYSHELVAMDKAPVKIGEVIKTPLRGVKIGGEEFWTNDEGRFKDLKMSARDAQLVEDDLEKLRQEAEE